MLFDQTFEDQILKQLVQRKYDLYGAEFATSMYLQQRQRCQIVSDFQGTMYTNHPLNVEVRVQPELSALGSDSVYFVLTHKNSLVMRTARREGQYVQLNVSVLDAGCRVWVVCGQLSQVIESAQNRSQVQYVKFDSEQFELNLFN